MAPVAIAAVDADVEGVTTHERRRAVAAYQPQAAERHGLVEQLHAGLAAQLAAVPYGVLARTQCVHPCPQQGADREQQEPGSEHRPSVGTPATLDKGLAGPPRHRPGYNPPGFAHVGEMMKLVFPGGEHAPVELREGTIIVGSSDECTVVLKGEGVAARHCAVRHTVAATTVRALDAAAPTVLNGRQVADEAAIKDGDLLVLGRVGCSVVAERKPAAAAPAKAESATDDRTRVRATLPRFLLRGVSGATLGKNYAVTDNAIIGRQPDCDLPIPAEEVSRHHARLKVTPEGVLVEDMGSANGTYINDKRIQSGLLKPGDELRLDTVRFLLITPGMDAKQQAGRPAEAAASATPASGGSNKGVLVVIGVVVLAAIAAAAMHFAGVF